MGAAVDRVDVVGEGEDVLGVGVVVLESDLDARRALPPLDVDRPMVEGLLVLVQVAHEADQAAFEVERLLVDRRLPLVDERDPDLLVEVGRLAQPLRDDVEVEIEVLEDLGVWLEVGRRSVPTISTSEVTHWARRLATCVALPEDLAIARRLDMQPLG